MSLIMTLCKRRRIKKVSFAAFHCVEVNSICLSLKQLHVQGKRNALIQSVIGQHSQNIIKKYTCQIHNGVQFGRQRINYGYEQTAFKQYFFLIHIGIQHPLSSEIIIHTRVNKIRHASLVSLLHVFIGSYRVT